MGDDGLEDCFVYVLGCVSAGRRLTYVGWTLDVERRLDQHNAGTGARTTRGRSWVLLHSERFTTRREAMSREWHLKRDRAFRRRLAERGPWRENVPDCDSVADGS